MRIVVMVRVLSYSAHNYDCMYIYYTCSVYIYIYIYIIYMFTFIHTKDTDVIKKDVVKSSS